MFIRLMCKSACRVIRTSNANLLNFLFSVKTREHNSTSSNAHLYNCKVLYYAFFLIKALEKKINITLLAVSGSTKRRIRQMLKVSKVEFNEIKHQFHNKCDVDI